MTRSLVTYMARGGGVRDCRVSGFAALSHEWLHLDCTCAVSVRHDGLAERSLLWRPSAHPQRQWVSATSRRRCTSKAKHSSAISFGRERDRPVCFSIRRNRWRTVFGWQISTSAAPRTDVSLSGHTRNVPKSISRSSSGRSPKPSNATATVWTITSTPTRVRIAGRPDLGSLTGAIVARNPLGNRPVHRRTG